MPSVRRPCIKPHGLHGLKQPHVQPVSRCGEHGSRHTCEVFVLDAGLNPAYGNDTLPDESIAQREVIVVPADNYLDYCRENVTLGTCECMGPATSEYSISDVLCSQVASFSVIAVNGVAQFSNMYAMGPTVSSAFDAEGYRLKFSSSGLLHLTFGIIVTEGAGYSFASVRR